MPRRPAASARSSCWRLVALLFSAVAGAGRPPAKPPKPRPVGAADADGHVRLRRHAPRPHGEVRRGRRHADLQEADGGRCHRRQRHAPGVPAEHRRRLVHDGDRRVSGRPRLDQQHLLPERRRSSPTGRRSRPPTSLQADTIANAAERAGKKVAQIDWVGGAAANIAGPTVDFTNFFSNRGVLVGAADPAEQAGSAFFGVTYQVADGRRRRPAGPTCRPATRPRRRRRRRWTIDSTFAAQNPNRTLQRLLLRQRRPAAASPTTTPSSARSARPARARRSTSRSATSCPQADGRQRADRRARRPDRRPLRQAHLARPGRQPVQALPDTSLARAIATLRHGAATACRPAAPARTSSRSTSPTTCCRGRPADFAPMEAGVIDEDTYVQQGRDLERAYSLAGHQLHPRHAPAGHRPRDGRLSVHRRGLAPVHGARLADRRGRRPEPVLRRRPEVRRRPVQRRAGGRTRRDPRGVHPERLPDADEKLGIARR